MTSTTAIFLWQGFIANASFKNGELDQLGGQVGAATEVANWATRLDACNPLLEGLEYPGVIEYEVIEVIGTMLRAYECEVSPESLDLAASRIARWFYPDDKPAQLALRDACSAAMATASL